MKAFKMAFTKKAFIKNFFLTEGYKPRRHMREIPEKGWKRIGKQFNKAA